MDTTTTFPRPLPSGRGGKPRRARSETSGSSRLRRVTTPRTADSDPAISETCGGTDMISFTRSSGRAYSCPARSKLTSAVPRSGSATVARASTVAATRRVAEADTPIRSNSPCSIRSGFTILIVPVPSSPLMTSSRRFGSRRPAPARSAANSAAVTLRKVSTRSTTNPSGVPRSIMMMRTASFIGASGKRRSRRRLITGTTAPRMLARPNKLGGARGICARFCNRTISPTSFSAKPRRSSATRTTRTCAPVASEGARGTGGPAAFRF